MSTKKLRLTIELKNILRAIENKEKEIIRKDEEEQKILKRIKTLKNKSFLDDSFEEHSKNNIACSKRKNIFNSKKINILKEELKNIPNSIENITIEEEIKKIEELLIVLEAEAREWNLEEALLDFEKRNILFSIKSIKTGTYREVVEVIPNDKEYIKNIKESINTMKDNIFNYESAITDINYTLNNLEEINKKNIDYNNSQYDKLYWRIEESTTKEEKKGWRKQLYNNSKEVFTKEELIKTLGKKEYYLKKEINYLAEREELLVSETTKLNSRTFEYEHVIENLIYYVETMYID